MAPASDSNDSNKHTCFNDSAMSKKQLPKTLAISFIKIHITTLQPDLAAFLKRLSTQHIKLLIKAYNKSKQLERLQTDDELIPHSACIKFTFHLSPATKQSDEFVTLQEGTQAIIKKCQQDL
eukprot:6497886-Ditylum_brightwellii.AAC.1